MSRGHYKGHQSFEDGSGAKCHCDGCRAQRRRREWLVVFILFIVPAIWGIWLTL